MCSDNPRQSAIQAPPGYKHTEVGVIPEDWRVTNLGSIAGGICRGASPRPIDNPAWFDDSSSIGWVRISDVTRSGRYLQETTQRLSLLGVQRSRFVPSGSLIMSICATVGRPIETGIDVCIHDGFVVFDRLRISQPFLYHVLIALEPTWSERGQTGSQMNLNTGIINRTRIPLPPTLPEQQAIASALSDADTFLTSLEQLITKKRQVKQGTMQELLTGHTRLPGFSGEWVVKRLDSVAKIRSGGTPSTNRPEFWDGDILWCTPTDITALSGRKYLSQTTRTITTQGLKASSAELIPAFSVVMTSRATIGECAINTVPVATNQGFKNFIPFENTDCSFLYYLLQTKKQAFISLCGGSTFLEIGKTQLAAFEVGLPEEKSEQTAIATILSDMDADIAALLAKLAKARQVKQGMMQELLTGRIRLI